MRFCTCSPEVAEVCRIANPDSSWAGGPLHPDWLVCGHAGEVPPT